MLYHSRNLRIILLPYNLTLRKFLYVVRCTISSSVQPEDPDSDRVIHHLTLVSLSVFSRHLYKKKASTLHERQIAVSKYSIRLDGSIAN